MYVKDSNTGHSNGAPFIYYGKEDDDKFRFYPTYYLPYPTEEAIRGTYYSSKLDTISNFVDQSVVMILRLEVEIKPSKSLEKGFLMRFKKQDTRW